MTDGQTNWNSRLVVKFITNDGTGGEIITPINNFVPTAELPKDVIDSIDGHNLGFSHGNPRYTFSFEVLAVNQPVFMRVFAYGMIGARFSVAIAQKDGESDDWVFDSIMLDDCVVTNVTPVDIDNSGKAPTMKFDGKCLSMKTSRNNFSVITNHTYGADTSGNV